MTVLFSSLHRPYDKSVRWQNKISKMLFTIVTLEIMGEKTTGDGIRAFLDFLSFDFVDKIKMRPYDTLLKRAKGIREAGKSRSYILTNMEELQSKLEALHEANDELAKENKELRETIEAYRVENDGLEGENEKLKEALKAVANQLRLFSDKIEGALVQIDGEGFN